MDVIDRAQAYEEQERAAAISQLARGPEPKIDLRRRRDCADCGDPIERARLRAVPSATRCTSCQSDAERRAA